MTIDYKKSTNTGAKRIFMLTHKPNSSMVEVFLEILDSDGKNIDSERHVIGGQKYIEFMSGNPPWSPNKPENTFRPEDIFKFLEK